jgi:TolA-binding protein
MKKIISKLGFSLGLLLVFAGTSLAQDAAPRSTRARVADGVDRRAKHLYDKAIELMEYKQYERGLAMLNTVIRDNQGTLLAHQAHMAMGRHHLDQHKTQEALTHFLLLSRVLTPTPGEKQSPEVEELYRESLFQTGFAYYQAGQYTSAFPMFRRLTEVAGKSQWANQAYFYIGMSHYNLKSWNKAIDALALVGTEIEDSDDDLGAIEIGQRFYSKITDADIPVLRKLGKEVKAQVKVSSGDSEILVGVPVAGKKDEMLTSAPTKIGAPIPNDGIIQLHGGDTLTVSYLDDSTLDGQKGVERSGKVRAVSTGTVGFYLGDFSTPAYLAFPGQPQALMLNDADLDTSDKAEQVKVTVKSMYKVATSDAAEEEMDDLLDIFAVQDEEADKWKERDSIEVTLVETGEGPAIRSGNFRSKVVLAALETDSTPNAGDAVLHCDELDELVVTYTDSVHVYGNDSRESTARIKVTGSVNSGVTADQYVVFEAVLKARKSSVEAEALKGLGAIYKDMGLDNRAGQRADEALSKLDPIILDRQKIPGDLVERAFQLKWESELLKDDFDGATATCMAFNRLYPQSVLADQALMTLSRGLAEKGEYLRAIDGYQRVLRLENPISAAEAQFRMGEVYAAKAKADNKEGHGSKWGDSGLGKSALQRAMGPAIAAYRKTYQTYPESAYASDALGRVVRHYVESEDYAQAASLLDQIFADFPDTGFLDEMLMLWAKVAYRMQDEEMAKAKLRQLVFEYPSSKHVAEARKKLAALEAN